MRPDFSVTLPPHCPRPPAAVAAPRCRGFTVVELLTVMAIAAIMTGMALPAMRSFIETNRVASEANGFVNDLQFARSEAIKQGVLVSLCASSNGSSCSNQNSWAAGWIVFADPDGSGTLDSTTESALRVRPAWSGNDSLIASPSVTSITYTRDGFATLSAGAGSTVLLTLRPPSGNLAATRCVSINRIGRQKVRTGSCA